MKVLSLLLPAALLAASASADKYDYTLSGDKACVLVNIQMDESGSMQTEQDWMRSVAVPAMVTKLQSDTYGYDYVFVCSNGFGEDSRSTNPAPGFRFLGCSLGFDPSILGWTTNQVTDKEDGYQAIEKAIQDVEAIIGGVDLASTCHQMDKNFIFVSDEDRDKTSEDFSIGSVREQIHLKGYILNLVVNVVIGTQEEKNMGARFDYDPDDYPELEEPIQRWSDWYMKYYPDYPNEVFSPDLSNGSWFVRKPEPEGEYWERENQYIYDASWKGLVTDIVPQSAEHYVPLITETRGAIWSITVLEEGVELLDDGNPMLSNAFANAFIDIKLDEICPNPPSCTVCLKPPCKITEIGGEPHIITWMGEHYEYHGQCDIVLVKDALFADGLGLDVQIRTKIVRFWAYIKNAAIRIGNDILEIEGSADPEDNQSRYWINYEYQGELNEFAGFPVTIKVQSTYKRVYEIDLSSKFPGEKISIHIYKEFVRVKFSGSRDAFGNTVGLLGDFNTGKTLARDGSTVLDDFTELGNEWQVLPAEPKLFHEVSHPQFPTKCVEPEDPRGERRRRLDENTVTEEQAEAACAFLKDPLSRKDCVYDIVATQDLDMVGAS